MGCVPAESAGFCRGLQIPARRRMAACDAAQTVVTPVAVRFGPSTAAPSSARSPSAPFSSAPVPGAPFSSARSPSARVRIIGALLDSATERSAPLPSGQIPAIPEIPTDTQGPTEVCATGRPR